MDNPDEDRRIPKKWAKRAVRLSKLFTWTMIVLGSYLLYTTYIS